MNFGGPLKLDDAGPLKVDVTTFGTAGAASSLLQKAGLNVNLKDLEYKLEFDRRFNRIAVPTVLQVTDDVIRYWTSMTCLYDRYWNDDPRNPTLPICLFHITKITPTYTVETSDRRVILHEPEGTKNLHDQLSVNNTRVIVDNSVKQPTQYNVDAIVPFIPYGRYITQGAKTMADLVSGFISFLGGNTFVCNSAISLIFEYASYIKSVTDMINRFPIQGGSSFINVKSLEAMAASCRVLCMKMWTGYEYKFVEMTGLTYEKKGAEDDIVRASFTLKERPVLIASKAYTRREARKNWRHAILKTSVKPLEWFTGVKSAAHPGVLKSYTDDADNAVRDVSHKFKNALMESVKTV